MFTAAAILRFWSEKYNSLYTTFIAVLHVQGRLRDGDQLQRHLQAGLHDEGARPPAKD